VDQTDQTRPIVCGVDHSSEARAAASAASGLSERLGSQIVLVHAVQPPIPAREIGMPVASTNFATVDQMREGGETLLEEIVAEVGAGREITTTVRIGSAAEVIAAVAEEVNAEFVVVGSRGLGSVGALLLGSVSLRLAAQGPCPTVIVPPSAGTIAEGPIMCAVDDSDGARAALATAAKLAERLGVQLLLVNAAHGDGDAPSAAGAELLAQLAFETGLGTNAERILLRGEPAGAIVEAADAHTAAMIVIGSRGRGALASSVLGSVSAAVANRSACPVIVVRGQAEPDPR
jgi:nucleotide-binding universal stress UspA family protein